MARRPRLFAPGLLYHVTARGNHRQPTFLAARDAEEYVKRLARYRARHGVTVYAYCLMPNHVHLLVQTAESPLAKFMQGLQQSYTLWFNRAYGTVGHLFQGRYHAVVCDSDRYLTALIRYIELNPVRAGLVSDPADYGHSSHREYLGTAATKHPVIDARRVLTMLGGREAYRRFVLAGMEHGTADAGQALHGPHGIDGADTALASGQPPGGPAWPAAGVAAPRPPEALAAALEDLGRRLGVSRDTLCSPVRTVAVAKARAVASYVLVRRMGFRVIDVAGAMRRDPSTICEAVARIERQLPEEPAMAAAVARAFERAPASQR